MKIAMRPSADAINCHFVLLPTPKCTPHGGISLECHATGLLQHYVIGSGHTKRDLKGEGRKREGEQKKVCILSDQKK
jgi:hypothetical protein